MVVSFIIVNICIVYSYSAVSGMFSIGLFCELRPIIYKVYLENELRVQWYIFTAKPSTD